MDGLREYLSENWFACVWGALALVLSIVAVLLRPLRPAAAMALWILGAVGALMALGGLVLPFYWASWTLAVPVVVLFGMVLVVIVTGRWWAPLGYSVGGLALVGLGGVCLPAVGRGLAEVGDVLLKLEAGQPWWLLLLLLVPLVVWLSFRSLAGLGPVRRWLAILLRCALIILLTLALAEVRIRHQNETVTVMFLVDRSLSIPEEWESDPSSPGKSVDKRWERIRKFINDAVVRRGPEHKRDKAGVIVFGRRPRLELPPSDVPNLNFTDVTSPIDGYYTDIGAAIKLALASFPEGTAKRIVLLSDGNENLGNAEEQARIAKTNDVQIDVVPLAAGQRNENEVLIQSVEAPSVTEQSAQLPIRVLVRSFNPRVVEGLLTLKQISDGETVDVPPSPKRVQVHPGLNPFTFKKSLTKQQQSYTYEATFQPETVFDDRGDFVRRYQPGEDRTENNRASTHVVALGQRRILLIEPKAGDHELLLDKLRAVGGDSKFKVHSIEAGHLPEGKADLGVFLSNYDCVILANVPAEMLTEEQQEMIRSNTGEQGCGLIMIGGPEGFGAGGWQSTPVEKALPVDCDIKSLKIQGKGGLVLIMHASEMENGNRWQKEIAKLAIKKLSVMDMMGMIYYDYTGGGHKWHIPFQEVGGKRETMLRLVEKMSPGDMPDVDPALQKAYEALTKPGNDLSTKHIIFISDGDHWTAGNAILSKLKANKITCTTVCITSHGVAEEQKMNAVARATGGRFYNVKSPKALPSIYIKETRIVSQSFVYEKRFQPRLLFKSGPTEKMPDALNALYGYVRTTPKASPLVQMPILAPPSGDQEFPILAFWQYGLGKAVAFTSDARSTPDRPRWDRDWAGSDMYLKFWEQVVDWSLRSVETGRLTMTQEYRDGKVKVSVDARDSNNQPLSDLIIRGGVTPPSLQGEEGPRVAAKPMQLKFEQKNLGVYEAEFKAELAGSYFINAQAQRNVKESKDGKEVVRTESDGVRSGITVPYSPEFADMECNVPLLEKLRSMTDGQSIAENEDALAQVARSGELFARTGLPPSKTLQPIWYWLLLLTGLLLFFDIAVRRIAVDPTEVFGKVQGIWERLRGRTAKVETTPQFMDRLKSRKEQISESLERSRGARRFEAGDAPVAAPAGADVVTPSAASAPVRPVPRLRPETKPEEEAGDYASRLMKAKKKVWEQREQEKDAPSS
jgi:uncharacterized membrane protein